jgi:outer membrane protein assembly factor BamD
MTSAIRTGRRLPAALAVLLVVAACSSTPDEPEYAEAPPEQLYANAEANFDAGNYRDAARGFEEVERQHPYSEWATRAQLMAADAYYENRDYDEAIGAVDRFVELHPGSADVPYALHLKGLSYYERISDVGRDQDMTREALETFDDLVRRYPGDAYARDAQLKIDLARDHLAGKEMSVGRYYQRQDECIAATNRYLRVVEEYQTTTHVPEALHRLTECYLALGLTEEARETAAVLGYNFPGSEWYQDSYALLGRPASTDG